MNRPLQLEGYLRSLYRWMPAERLKGFILYRRDRFDQSYCRVFSQFPQCTVIEEADFRRDFLGILESVSTPFMLFGTDDVVYYDGVRWEVIERTFETAGPAIFGFSLRLDPESLSRQGEVLDRQEVLGEPVARLNWKKARTPNGRYPFELNSTIMRTQLVRQVVLGVDRKHPLLAKWFQMDSPLVRVMSGLMSHKRFILFSQTFRNPNSLEGLAYRWCRAHKRQLPNELFFQKPCASALQVNIVNTVVDNPIDGSANHTVEALNRRFVEGYRLDLDSIAAHKPNHTHVGWEFFRLSKMGGESPCQD